MICLLRLEQEEASFKQRLLRSLTDELLCAGQQLSLVSKHHTSCLEEFLRSHTLIRWVQENLRSETPAVKYSHSCPSAIEWCSYW